MSATSSVGDGGAEPRRPTVVVAVGGNALLKREESPTAENQRRNVAMAAARLGDVARDHTLVVTHGNGPQIGLLALQAEAGNAEVAQPLDILGAESDGMIGTLVAQELRSCLPGKDIAVLLTQVRVRPGDPAFRDPTKPIGRVYERDEAERVARERGWAIVQDGDGWRRAVPSPKPIEVLEIGTIRLLVEAGTLVICGGGGGIPVFVGPDHGVRGVEAVIDKDATTELIARGIDADLLVLLTDVRGLYRDFGGPDQTLVERIGAGELRAMAEELPRGSIGPKARAAADFVTKTGCRAAIGRLEDAAEVVAGTAGTQVVPD